MEKSYSIYLNELIKDAPSIEIKNIFSDSRLGSESGMFFCVKGLINDGHHYVKQAIENGAVAIVYHDELSEYKEGIYYHQVEDVNTTLNEFAAKFYKNPSEKLNVFAVTGTNGKTTVASLIKDILSEYESVGYIGTINIEYANKKLASSHTTPEVISLQEIMAKMVDEDIKSLAIEVSSHAIEQKRVLALNYNFAIFTNLSHEHLDYHGTMENYYNTKASLFKNNNKHISIINNDDEYGKRLISELNDNVVTYGILESADFYAKDIVYGITNTSFTLVYNENEYEVVSNLVAEFNVYNLLASIATLVSYGLDINKLVESVKNLNQISGRVQRIDCGQNFEIIVDYAHTPAGFLEILKYAKSIVNDKKIITVFGSAGKRDILKRKILGEVASEFSDLIILTEDDPRNESVLDISKQIAEGIDSNYVIVENRYDAIYQAIELANSNDIILILGKGDDRFMARNSKEEYPGDVAITVEILREYLSEERK